MTFTAIARTPFRKNRLVLVHWLFVAKPANTAFDKAQYRQDRKLTPVGSLQLPDQAPLAGAAPAHDA